MSRLPVKKTYKLFVGGAFPRSESGRTYEAEGQNVARASRKDVRDAVVALASETQPLAAIELAEAIATSDVPGGVVNLLTGHHAELAPWLASHMDVNAIDLTGADDLRASLEAAAAENVKRVVLGAPDTQSLYEISAFLELKTVWHPIGT